MNEKVFILLFCYYQLNLKLGFGELRKIIRKKRKGRVKIQRKPNYWLSYHYCKNS